MREFKFCIGKIWVGRSTLEGYGLYLFLFKRAAPSLGERRFKINLYWSQATGFGFHYS